MSTSSPLSSQSCCKLAPRLGARTVSATFQVTGVISVKDESRKKKRKKSGAARRQESVRSKDDSRLENMRSSLRARISETISDTLRRFTSLHCIVV